MADTDGLKGKLQELKTVEDGLTSNKVAQFAYTQKAYTDDKVSGHSDYVYDRDDNIPTADAATLNTNVTVLDKGFRSQASSIPRMLLNHFFGRMSYNLNKVNDVVSSLIYNINTYMGSANGLATLDANGRIPYSQLPESAMEYKGNWNAATNTPTLVNGTGTKGDFYIVSVAGTQFSTAFKINDRVIYDGSTWSRLPNGAVSSVNEIQPVNENVTITGANIATSSTDNTKIDTALAARQKNVIKLTQAEYDALSYTDKKGNLYIITDATAFDQKLIEDFVQSSDTTWSSNKIAETTLCRFGTCTPSSSSSLLEVYVKDAPYPLPTGFDVSVKFSSTYSYTEAATMSINFHTAYPVTVGGLPATAGAFAANRTYTFHFTGSSFDCLSNANLSDIDDKLTPYAKTSEVNTSLSNYAKAINKRSIDLNTITDNGLFWVYSSCTNAPDYFSGGLIMQYYFSDKYCIQQLISQSGLNQWFRSNNNGTWGAWQKLAKESDLKKTISNYNTSKIIVNSTTPVLLRSITLDKGVWLLNLSYRIDNESKIDGKNTFAIYNSSDLTTDLGQLAVVDISSNDDINYVKHTYIAECSEQKMLYLACFSSVAHAFNVTVRSQVIKLADV